MLNLFDYNISYKHVLLILCAVVLFCSILYMVYHTYKYLRENSILSTAVDNIYYRFNEQSKKRKKERLISKIRKGNEIDRSFIGTIDRMYVYSGIPMKLKWLTTEMLITIVLIEALAVIVVATYMSGDIIIGGLCGAVDICFIIIGTILLCNVNYIKVEDSLPDFMSNIQNFSGGNNDIITVLEKAVPYTKEPIKSAVNKCVLEARNSGNVIGAMERLEDSIENDYFKMLVKNLATCSKYSNDYIAVIDESKEIVEQFIAFEKEKRQYYSVTRKGVLTLAVLGVLVVKETVVYNGNSLKESLISADISEIYIILFAVAVLIIIYIAFIKGLKH